MYQVEYAEDERPLEEVIEQDGVKIYVDPLAMMFILALQWIMLKARCNRALFLRTPTKPAAAAVVSLSRSNGRISNAQSNIRASCRRASEIDAEPGKSLLVTAQQNDIDIEGACEGVMACSTCHLIVSEDWFKKLPDASEEEEDMLDLAYGLTKTSRLGCQITVTEDLDGLVLRVPDETAI